MGQLSSHRAHRLASWDLERFAKKKGTLMRPNMTQYVLQKSDYIVGVIRMEGEPQPCYPA